jgi:hypothetical protein
VAPVGESVAAGVTRHVLPSKPLIRDHEAACAAYESTRKATANMLPSNPRYRAAEAAERRTDDREMKTLLALLGCIHPTSTAGEPGSCACDRSGGDGETRGLPIPWQEIGDLICWMVWEACQHVGEPSLRIDVVEFACLDEGIDRGSSVAPCIGTREGPIFSSDGHHPFILPMSGGSWKSITAGIPILAARSLSGA